MQTVERVIIQATPAAIWHVLADVERWPTWTPTVQHVQPLTPDGLRLGARYRVTQPKLRPAVYEVTELAPHKVFTWIQKAPGATLIADHRLIGDASPPKSSFPSPPKALLGALLGSMYAKRIAEYVKTEARSLKAHCEKFPAAATAYKIRGALPHATISAMPIVRHRFLAACIAALACAAPLHAASPEDQAVLAPVQALFAGMANRDAAAIRAPLLPGGSLTLMRDGKPVQMSFDDFAARVAKPGTDAHRGAHPPSARPRRSRPRRRLGALRLS